MGLDIFGNEAHYAGGFRKSGNTTTFALSDKFGRLSLVQDFNVQYSQNVQPLYEVGSANVYFTQSAGSGTLSINRIISTQGTQALWTMNACDPGQLSMKSSESGGQCLESAVAFHFDGCVTQQVGWQGQAQNAFITEGITIMFASVSK